MTTHAASYDGNEVTLYEDWTIAGNDTDNTSNILVYTTDINAATLNWDFSNSCQKNFYLDWNDEDWYFDGWKTRYDGAEHIVTVIDKLGNKTEYKITVYKIHTVTFTVDDKEYATVQVNHGMDAALPEVPAKDGYTAAWDMDGKAITADTTITAVYTAIPTTDSPQTGDNTNLWLGFALMFVSGGALFEITVSKRKRKTT